MSKGFLWFAQNNSKTDYVELSIKLARSIKKWNRHNTICVITDAKSKFESEHVDIVKVLKEDDSETPEEPLSEGESQPPEDLEDSILSLCFVCGWN